MRTKKVQDPKQAYQKDFGIVLRELFYLFYEVEYLQNTSRVSNQDDAATHPWLSLKRIKIF